MKENNLENIEKNIEITIAKEDDWKYFKEISLEAILKEPKAFFITKEKEKEEYNKSKKEWINELKDKNNFTILLKNNKEVFGMCQAILKNKQNNLWHIRGVYIRKEFRGKKIGENLLNFTINEIKKRKGEKITLNVANSQTEVLRLYEKLGFITYSVFNSKEVDQIKFPEGKYMFKSLI